MPKQTRLDEQDALIYHPQKEQTEKEKLREMNFQEKLSYLWEYYKWYFIGAVVFIALVIYFINGILHPSVSPQFYASMINNPIDDQSLQDLQNDFTEHLQLNTKRDYVEFNTSINYNMGGAYTVTMEQALTTYIANHEVDVIIAPESIFQKYAYSGTFKKLSDELPTDLYSSLTDQFYMSNTEDLKKVKSVYGIYLTNTKMYQKYADKKEPYVLGIIINSPHQENSIEFIRYLFGMK